MMSHANSIAQVLKEFDSSKAGLPVDRVVERQKKHGKNILSANKQRMSKLRIFFGQFSSPLMIILFLAGLVSGLLGEYSDTIVIAITLILNAFVGFLQENKANEALKKLQQMVTYKTIVIRSGKQEYIASEDIVVGDVLVLTAGDKMQADGRLIEVADLVINEAILTGESAPVKKHTKILAEEVSLADRTNMIYRGTTVVGGRGLAVVTAIGKDTEVGHIATLVNETVDEQTPLQNQLSRLGKQLGILVIAISVFVVLLGLLRGNGQYHLIELLRTAIAVAVAAVPEGLVISLTVILAIGMQQILKRQALVRRLVAAETLGSVSVICTDKTGTLTEGKMSVTEIQTADELMSQLEIQKKNDPKSLPTSIEKAIQIGVLCNDVIVRVDSENSDKKQFLGDTTEVALSDIGLMVGINREELEVTLPRISEVPFSSEAMYMATAHADGNEKLIYVKGAPEVVLSRSLFVMKNGKPKKMTKTELEQFQNQAKKMAERGLRVLGVGYRISPKNKTGKHTLKDTDIHELVFVGLVGMSDPLRAEVIDTFQVARQAGIHIIMITGDHISTAKAIGKQLGLVLEDGSALEGADIDHISDDDLRDVVKKVTVFARVSPRHKIRIVRACQANGEIVAMTGDGVNDAPALKGADIGVAVGSGTDVAKETADLVLLNDSFATIVSAIEEGRRIYQNIKKVVLYLLVGSLAEVLLIVGSIIAGLPIALLPAQILWINIVQETFPTMALAFDPGDKHNMLEPPRKRSQSLFDPVMKSLIATVTIITNLLLFAIFYFYTTSFGSPELARTMMFAGLGIGSLFYLYSIRSERLPVWKTSIFDNVYVTLSVLFGILMMVIALYLPVLQNLLGTVPLALRDWIVILIFSVVNVLLIELVKWRVGVLASMQNRQIKQSK